MNQFLTMVATMGQKVAGIWTKPRLRAKGESVSQMPMTQIAMVVTINGQLARLWINGIFWLRITWMIRVCVKMDSINHAV